MCRVTIKSRGTPGRNGPLRYRIKVHGVIPASWTDRLGGLRVVADAHEISTLEGPLADQAALFGVLDVLYQLGLPILEMKTLKRTKGVAG